MSVPEYLPGAWSAVSRPGFVALLGPAAGPATARALWEASADGLLAGLVVLARNGFGGLPSFALVHVERGRAHLALRGDVTAEVGTPSGSHTVRAGEVGTWSEQVFDDVAWVRLRSDDAPEAGTGLPLGDGVAAACALRVVLVEGEEGESSAGTAQEAPAAAGADAPATAAAVAVIDVPDVPPPAAETASEPVLQAPVPDEAGTGEPARDAAFDEPVAEEPVPDAFVADEAAASEPVADEAAAGVPAADAPVPDESQLDDEPADGLAHDVTSPDEPAEAGQPVTAADAPVGTAFVPASSSAGPVLQEPDQPQPAQPVPEQPEPVLPGVLPAQADAPEPVPVLVALGAAQSDVESTVDGVRTLVGPASPDDHDGLTILSSDLAQIREQLPAWAAQWPQEGQAPGSIAAPTLAVPAEAPRLLLSTGVEVTLDRTVLLGRAPQVARVTNRELPRLVAVPSPQQDISRTHAEVRAEGEHVLVTDLHSTNGVHVSRQGEGARRLHPGEPSVVVAGEVVDLGDGVTFTVAFAPDAGGR